MKDIIRTALRDSAALHILMAETMTDIISAAAAEIVKSFMCGGKLLLFGNGGSAADAQHIAAEFINRFTIERASLPAIALTTDTSVLTSIANDRFKIERAPLPAIALTTDTSVLTSIANDRVYDEIFSRQVEALGRRGDVALGITTSGSSENVLNGLFVAADRGMKTIALTGELGRAASLADIGLRVPSQEVPRIQEAHIAIGHILYKLVDSVLIHKQQGGSSL